MKDRETIKRQARPETGEGSRRRYQSPTLISYGSLAKLTQSGGGSAVDGINTMMMVPSGP